jgi:hypothetical protein
MDTYTATHFPIIRESILQIMSSYANMLLDKVKTSMELDIKIARIMDIIDMLNRAQQLMLDRNIVLAYVFEKFFSMP